MVKVFLRRILTLIALSGPIFLSAKAPDVIYLTWTEDPTTTMTVVWQGGDGSRVLFHALKETKWMSVSATSYQVPGTEVYVYQAHIERLKSNEMYLFKIEGDEKEYKFRTLPSQLTDRSKVQFVVGGDIFYHKDYEVFEQMGRVMGGSHPDFVVLGGDLAYVRGSKSVVKNRSQEMARWQDFLRRLQQVLTGEEGRMVPLVPVVGNHDVFNRGKELDIFYEIFPFPLKNRSYRILEMGNYLSLVLLDTGHTWPIEGDQTDWLKKTLKRTHTPYLFAAYHVGAYPASYHHSYKGKTPTLLRKTWSPLFEEAQISGAFEHHSHVFKRTYSIRQEKKDPKGVIYLGDGSWGVPPRRTHTPEELWFLEKSASTNACWFVKLTEKEAAIEARNPKGEVIDEVTILPRIAP